ncbi:MAG: hypothetical protein AB7F59_11670 [Bdellovibrionales bacterium]
MARHSISLKILFYFKNKSCLVLYVGSFILFPLAFSVASVQNFDSNHGVSKFCKHFAEDESRFVDFQIPLQGHEMKKVRVEWPKLELSPRLLSSESIFISSMSLALETLSEQGHLEKLEHLHILMNLPDDAGFGAAFCTNLQTDSSTAVLLVNRRTMTQSQQLMRLIPHELAHWAMDQHKKDFPRWFEETLGTIQEFRTMKEPTGPWFLATLRFPQMGLTSLESNNVLEDPNQRLAAYGQVALFSIFLEKHAKHSLLTFALKKEEQDPFKILEDFVDKYLHDKFDNLKEAFIAFIVAKHINRLNNATGSEDPELTLIYPTTEVAPTFSQPPLLQPWSGISVALTLPPTSSELEKEYWVETSMLKTTKIAPLKSHPKCPFEECLRLRIRFD